MTPNLEPVFALGVWLVTTVIAALVLRRRTGAAGFRPALRRTLETLGAAVLFFLANIAVGVAFSIAARAFGVFVSVYLNVDPALSVLSVVQALFVTYWLDEPRD